MEIRDLMERIVKLLEKAYYGDVRFDRSWSTFVSKNKSEEYVTKGSSHGMCVRILSGDEWRYLGFDEIDDKRILDETRKLVSRVGDKKSKFVNLDPWKIDEEVKVKKDPEDVSVEEKLNVTREIFRGLTENKTIIDAFSLIAHSKNEVIFMNTEGSNLRQVIPRFRFSMSATAREGKDIDGDYFFIAKQGGYELFESIDVESKIKEVVNGSLEALRAKMIKGGKHDVIVDPEISGVIAHESFGHGLEADQVMRGRSYLADLKGKEIVSELISMHDDGSLRGERGCVLFDDEGTKSGDTILVKDGVLNHFLHDRQTAALMRSNPTGNARAQDFSRKVFVRMTNTYIEPRDWKLEELIRDTKRGYFLIKSVIGMEDPIGGSLQVTTKGAREIKNGELEKLYKGVGMAGNVLEVLNNVDAITDDLLIKGSGCGKGHEDYVPVSSGGPHMRIREVIIG